mmetsp:Transcript_4351/g.13159  ORF Transcript_4351/g.13159 Transcript_4351/m.13159 type:complete len:466 (+) Transcript_4351:130-1527(+)
MAWQGVWNLGSALSLSGDACQGECQDASDQFLSSEDEFDDGSSSETSVEDEKEDSVEARNDARQSSTPEGDGGIFGSRRDAHTPEFAPLCEGHNDGICREEITGGVSFQGGILHRPLYVFEGQKSPKGLSGYTLAMNVGDFSEKYYNFLFTTFKVGCSFGHVQLRHLVAATTNYDVYVMGGNRIYHWDARQRVEKEILNFNWMESNGVRPMDICTINAMDNFLVVGGKQGELTVMDTYKNKVLLEGHASRDYNSITNALDLHWDKEGRMMMLASSNDHCIRQYEMETLKVLKAIQMDWPVNHTTRQPSGGSLLCVGGDDFVPIIYDVNSNRSVMHFSGFDDYIFGTTWHPDGNLVALGSQDRTCRIFDLRFPSQSILRIDGLMGAIRSVRFTADGNFLVVADDRDYVYIIEKSKKYQLIDMVGEITGVGLSPEDDSMFIGVLHHSSGFLLEFEKRDWKRASQCLF